MESKEFIFRESEPRNNYVGQHTIDEDINTIIAEEIFDGIVYVFNVNYDDNDDDNISKIFSSHVEKILSYDVVKKIDCPCYVRIVRKEPGIYSESWREPNIEELELFFKYLKYLNFNPHNKNEYDITSIEIYKWYIQKNRNSKIDSIIRTC